MVLDYFDLFENCEQWHHTITCEGVLLIPDGSLVCGIEIIDITPMYIRSRNRYHILLTKSRNFRPRQELAVVIGLRPESTIRYLYQQITTE